MLSKILLFLLEKVQKVVKSKRWVFLMYITADKYDYGVPKDQALCGGKGGAWLYELQAYTWAFRVSSQY